MIDSEYALKGPEEEALERKHEEISRLLAKRGIKLRQHQYSELIAS